MTDPYRQNPNQTSTETDGRWIYADWKHCPYCGTAYKGISFIFDEYSSDLYGKVCRPHHRHSWTIKSWWIFEKIEFCQEPAHHVHLKCSTCKSWWLFEIAVSRTSVVK